LTLRRRELVIGETCQSCGICTSLCPTGALELKKGKESEVINRVKTYLDEQPARIIRFKCQKDLEYEDAVVLPCVYSLTENILLSAFLHGAKGVELKLSDCSNCPSGKSDFSLQKSIGRTQSILNWLGVPDLEIKTVTNFSVYESVTEKGFSPGRRHFLTDIREEMRHMISAVLPQSRNGFHPPGPKRALLLNILRKITEIIKPEDHTIHHEENLPFTMVDIDDNCLGCNVCSTLCHTSALQRIVDKESVSIKFLPRFCVKCGLCQEVCLPKAIKLNKTISTEILMTTDYHELIKLEREKEFLVSEKKLMKIT
jgi:ferredoxin